MIALGHEFNLLCMPKTQSHASVWLLQRSGL
ncbi:Hypothetical protein Bdt_3543 [Bdellovibrio bacteriovorus str. Tiberius]|uniref:Uncharacterized protein n=1 Tax=Bdellovibrio bacteriovorus str. Tiberius TaxID=1069642 RepID=K7YZN6_BDEBC|nr:Hypothetical protein Bdt_3543 [Bdellovibrio bacteriovorus str. Tiberius]